MIMIHVAIMVLDAQHPHSTHEVLYGFVTYGAASTFNQSALLMLSCRLRREFGLIGVDLQTAPRTYHFYQHSS